jgi:hypothetical protein
VVQANVSPAAGHGAFSGGPSGCHLPSFWLTVSCDRVPGILCSMYVVAMCKLLPPLLAAGLALRDCLAEQTFSLYRQPLRPLPFRSAISLVLPPKPSRPSSSPQPPFQLSPWPWVCDGGRCRVECGPATSSGTLAPAP